MLRLVSSAETPEMSSDATAANERLEAVYREHFDFVWRSVRRLGVPEAAVDDVTQEVFVVVARRLHTFEGRSSLKTWLFGLAMRVVRLYRRTTWRFERKRRAAQVAIGDDGHDPWNQADAARVLLHLLDCLPDHERAVYVLGELEGMTTAEVAEGLQINPNTAYSRLRSARKRMQQAVARRLAADAREGGA
jgi:RNA polymerase sigma-70 factor (ECF subfamily)